MIKSYISLTKPGIIFGNLITAAAGFFLASKGLPDSASHWQAGHINLWLFALSMIGISFGIASACVFNNYIDRDIDQKMERTKNRALAKGLISGKNALIFGIFLGIIGVLILLLYTNLLTVSIGILGGFFYVVLYGIWKRRSVYGTIVGSISGAIPPVAGYCAVSNRLDAGAIILFMILVLWQMPHFYAIAIFRYKEYAAASIPVLPVKKGKRVTKIHMLCYIFAFIIATCLLTVFRLTGYTYLVVTLILGVSWFIFGVQGLKTHDDIRWARKMFAFSLVVIILLSVMIAVDTT